MKINVLESKIVMSNDTSIHNYFGWPTVARLKDGRLAMVASGFRLAHICPFGKCVISFSNDEGKTWSLPTPVIDTLLDDRDGGITAFGESSVIVTSFNNAVSFQREHGEGKNYKHAYLDIIEAEYPDWNKYLGSTFRISHDNGTTFGEIKKIPVTCPHGPVEMSDGTLLYVGRKFSDNDQFRKDEKHLACYRVFADGSYELISEIENVGEGFNSCEPYTFRMKNGKLICHIRMEGKENFSIFQSESLDDGKTWTKPHQLLPERGGAPAHIIEKDGVLISTYGYRKNPYGIRVMFSYDGGETWDTDHVLVDNEISGDLGYPSSVVLADGNILTIYYARRNEDRTVPNNSSVIKQIIWNFEK
ncbi:MAG: exo-alpha-sialidase [Clostridia bacterium]|nr:exo-alpha-sialidase [Clostridia bacterium]